MGYPIKPRYGPWHEWFAWHPVHTDWHGWRWLTRVERRFWRGWHHGQTPTGWDYRPTKEELDTIETRGLKQEDME